MTEFDNKQLPVSPILTETGKCLGQNQEGKSNDEIWTSMIQDLLKHYEPFTYDELVRYLGYEQYDLFRKPGQPFMDECAWYPDYMMLREKRHKLLEQKYIEWKKKKPTASHAGYELGPREFTLTYSPHWMSDREARVKMKKAIDKLCKYYKDEIVELHAVGEVGSNGLSHVHCYYELKEGRKITDKNFKRAWEHWNPKKPLGKGRNKGFEGGHHENVKDKSNFRGYIEKELASAWMEKNVAIESQTNGIRADS